MQKTLWSIINLEVGNKQSKHTKNTSLKETNNVITDPRIISNKFNNYFLNNIKDNSFSRFGYDNIDSSVNCENKV